MDITFKDKFIVITAGASGIGYNIAKGFDRYGATIFVCDVDAEKVESLNNEDNNIYAFLIGPASLTQP